MEYRCIYNLLTIFYKTLQEKEPQYLAYKHHINKAERMTRHNKSNTKLLQVHSTRKAHEGIEDLVSQDPITGKRILNYIKVAEDLGKFKKNF